MTGNPFNRGVAAGVLSVALLVGATTMWAQRPLSGKFDLTKTQDLKGIVTYVDWRNPQVHIFVNVKGPAAQTKGKAKAKAAATETLNWAVELPSATELEMSGWTRESLSPGEMITVHGLRARDGSRQVWGQEVRYASSGLPVFPAKPVISRLPLAPRPTPRWPDGHPALGALPGMADGYWTAPSKTSLIEDGVDVKMTEYGLLTNLADAAKVAPFQPWALGVYQHRQQRQLQDDPLFVNCKPPGGPRQYQSSLGIQLIEDQAHKRVFVLMGGGNHNFRIIYLDGRKQVGLQGGDDDNPLYYGRSAGRWEGDTLVVDIIGFNEDFWFTQGGLPHTDQLHLIERFTRTDNETLRYQVEVDDPGGVY